ncbi:aldehyde dehydrogenase (plasmid) [Novosphingobium pentaromativorans US6-1]|nr:aldehyde dehydrogenase [Novosphingobium pentaromativorans US6-1]
MPEPRHAIGGRRLSTDGAGRWSHVDPSTGEVQALVPMGGAAEIDAAVTAARTAFPMWRDTPGVRRREIMERLARLLDEHRDELARLTVLENGASMATALHMTGLARDWMYYYAGWADRLDGRVASDRAYSGFAYTVPEPLGVIASIITWNGPIMSMGMKLSPAIATGNCVVYKPAEINPFTSQRFLELALEAGLPEGVLNIVHGGAEAGGALTSHPDIAKISFTGGDITAHKILDAANRNLRPALLELGGKSANLVFADADLDTALDFSVGTCMVNAGQGCSLPTRMLVERSIYDEVVERAAAVARAMPIGDPLLESNFVGPVITPVAGERILNTVARASAESGARVVTGGVRMEGEYADGWFIEPTILADVPPQSDVFRKEVFGPVLTITPFDSEEEAIELANGTPYGLAAYAQTNNHARIRRLGYALDAGSVLFNSAMAPVHFAPFGGVGLSGYGKEGGPEGLEEFIHRKTVMIG